MQQWVQAFAPFAAALVVLVGVILTLRHNSKRLRQEQLETRAKEQEERLHQHYATFIGLMTGLLNDMIQFHVAREDTASEQVWKDPLLRKELSAIMERSMNAASQKTAEANVAKARLALIDDNPSRLEVADRMLHLVTDWTQIEKQGVSYVRSLQGTVRLFAADVGKSLDTRYRNARGLAAEGREPKPHSVAPREAQKIT